tara:strand:+ start:2496 stop:3020 length:525 start_codon:yes stop_codon:yes gene_type:complete
MVESYFIGDGCQGCIENLNDREKHTFDSNCIVTCTTCRKGSHRRHCGICLPHVQRRSQKDFKHLDEKCKICFLQHVSFDEIRFSQTDDIIKITQLRPSQKHRVNELIKASTCLLLGTDCAQVTIVMGKKELHLKPSERMKIARVALADDVKAFYDLSNKQSTQCMIEASSNYSL